MSEEINECVALIRRELHHEPIGAAIVLGSGWSQAMADVGETVFDATYASLPGFLPPAVSGHSGQLRVVRLDGGNVLCFSGRTHLYEGHGVEPTLQSVRLASALSIKTVVLTNGCGSVHSTLDPGSPVILTDHINLTGVSPFLGPVFIDCSEVYSRRLRELTRTIAPTLKEGVYAQFRGPQYETPAEVRMARAIGADLVGMSTAIEALESRRLGMEVLGLSLVTNLAAGVSAGPLDHSEVLSTGASSADRLKVLLTELLPAILRANHMAGPQ
jgi:purine-nucleoside phosphorylase